jgi:hypothetical protein
MKIAVEVRAESDQHGGLMDTIGWALLDTRDNTLSAHLYDGPCDAQDSADLANASGS